MFRDGEPVSRNAPGIPPISVYNTTWLGVSLSGPYISVLLFVQMNIRLVG